MSSACTSDIVNALVDSSSFSSDEIYIHEKNHESQETEIEPIIATPSISFCSESLEFFVMLYQVSSGVSSFNRCMKFSPKLLQISVGSSDAILLAVSEVSSPRKLMSLFLPSLGVTYSESITLHLPDAYDGTLKQIVICNDDYKFAAFSHSIL